MATPKVIPTRTHPQARLSGKHPAKALAQLRTRTPKEPEEVTALRKFEKEAERIRNVGTFAQSALRTVVQFLLDSGYEHDAQVNCEDFVDRLSPSAGLGELLRCMIRDMQTEIDRFDAAQMALCEYFYLFPTTPGELES